MNIQSLSRDELRALLTAARARRERDYLMILIAFSHGLRATELINLTKDNFAGGFITVARLKGSDRTTQPLVEDAESIFDERNAVFDYLPSLHENQRLFKLTRQRFFQIIREHGAAAGIPRHKLHPHVLKHTIAMQTIETAGIQNVRKYLGHKSMSSTGVYLQVTDDAASKAIGRALRDRIV